MKKANAVPALEFLQVTKTFEHGTIRAVNEVSLSIKSGEIFGLVGPNGAGKSTLLRLAVGILRPDSGRILVGGVDLSAEPLKAKRLLGYAAAEPLVYERMTGYRYLAFMAAAFRLGRESNKKIDQAAGDFGIREALPDVIGRYPPALRQKLSLAAVFLHDPAVIILDEPWANLDPQSIMLVKDKMKAAAAAGRAVFFSTYHLDVAQKLAGRLGIMRRGVLAAAGTFTALKKLSGKKGAPLETVYLELSR